MDAVTSRAVDAVLRHVERTGDDLADLVAAGRAVMVARDLNVLRPIVRGLREHDLSWRQIEAETGIDVRTARRWANEGEP